MDVQLLEASYEDKPVLRNLLELYLYDFSEFIDCDVNEHGLYDYGYLDHYWTEEGRCPFLIRVDGKLAGFVLVWAKGQGADRHLLITEFFVMRKYRRRGVGKQAAFQAFDRFSGVWRIGEVKTNTPAVAFWRAIIAEYTRGSFQDVTGDPDWEGPMQVFETPPAG